MWKFSATKFWISSRIQLWYRTHLYPRSFEKIKILKFKIWEIIIYISGTLNDLKQKFYQQQSYRFCLYPTLFEKDMNFFVPRLFLRIVDLVNHPWKPISRDSRVNKSAHKNHPCLETVDISNHPRKSFFRDLGTVLLRQPSLKIGIFLVTGYLTEPCLKMHF
jgi:hypothetical protein